MNEAINESVKERDKEKILLVLLPFWTPQIPPMGLACLKSYLQREGYTVNTADLNVVEELGKINSGYFEILKQNIPEDKLGNLFNVGQDVLRNHLMAHLNYTGEKEYNRLVEMLIYQNFFVSARPEAIEELNRKVKTFYDLLEPLFTALLKEHAPDVLGFSVYDGSLPASLFAAQLARKIKPQLKIVIGGGVFAEQLSKGSPNWERFLNRIPYIDKIFIGEGEQLFLKYLRGELDPDTKVYTLDNIDREILDLSIAPIPDFSDFDLKHYPVLASYASRSCPFQCGFCSETIQWGKYRKKKAPQIVEELMHLHKNHGTQLVLMCDSLLNPVVKDLSATLIDAGASMYWDGYLRADKPVCNTENTMQWRRGGFYRARLGVESGSPNVLDKIGKGITPEQVGEALYSLALAGIKTTTYWVAGYPGETEEDFQMTLDLLSSSKDNIYEAWVSPFFYYYSGQVKADEWINRNRTIFPDEMLDMLMLQTWVVDMEPSREVAYDRVSRFVQHCKKMGIPNPTSMLEVQQADERWKRLHKNAVPPLMEFKKDGVYIDENTKLKQLNLAKPKELADISFDL